MGVVVSQQGLAFLAAIASGCFAALVFHILRVVRKEIFRDKKSPLIFDCLFWLSVLGCYSTLYFVYTYNIPHLYILLGMLCGSILYHTILTPLVTAPVLNGVRRIVKAVVSFCKAPHFSSRR